MENKKSSYMHASYEALSVLYQRQACILLGGSSPPTTGPPTPAAGNSML